MDSTMDYQVVDTEEGTLRLSAVSFTHASLEEKNTYWQVPGRRLVITFF